MQHRQHQEAFSGAEELCALYKRLIGRERELCEALEKIDRYKARIASHRAAKLCYDDEQPRMGSSAVVRKDASFYVREPQTTVHCSSSLSQNEWNANRNGNRRSSLLAHFTPEQIEQQNELIVQLEQRLGENARPKENVQQQQQHHTRAGLRTANPILEAVRAGVKLRPTTPCSLSKKVDASITTCNGSVGSLLLQTINSRRCSITGLARGEQEEEEEEALEEFDEW